MENIKLTKEQNKVIQLIQSNGFKKDEKNSGFEKENDGTFFYTFHAKNGMGCEMIQPDGQSVGGLLKSNQ